MDANIKIVIFFTSIISLSSAKSTRVHSSSLQRKNEIAHTRHSTTDSPQNLQNLIFVNSVIFYITYTFFGGILRRQDERQFFLFNTDSDALGSHSDEVVLLEFFALLCFI